MNLQKKNNCFLLFFLVFNGSYLFAQSLTKKEIKGKIKANSEDLSNVHILNITSQKATISDLQGYFIIPASVKDTLVFSAVQFKRDTLVMTKEILDSKFIYVYLEERINELEEVLVMPYGLTGDLKHDVAKADTDGIVTAASLGLPNAYVVPLEPSERRLVESNVNDPLFTPTSINVYKLLNLVSGRIKKLKDKVALEKETELIEATSKEFYTITSTYFKIPESYIDNFFYFCAADEDFQKTVSYDDSLLLLEFLQSKSVEFKENNSIPKQ